MEYLKLIWLHDNRGDPIVYFLELDEDRLERRKVELYSNGDMKFASLNEECGTFIVETRPLPSRNELEIQNELKAFKIECEEFEDAWSKARIRCK